MLQGYITIRDKIIAHFTNCEIEDNLTWGEADNALELIQKITNKYLKIYTNKNISDWKFILNTPFMHIFHNQMIPFKNGEPDYTVLNQ